MADSSELTIEKMTDGMLLLTLGGTWQLGQPLPATDRVFAEVAAGKQVTRIGFATDRLGRWDSGLLIFLARLYENCRRSGISIDETGLPEGVRKLMDLAAPEHQRSGVTRGEESRSFLVRVAEAAIGQVKGIQELLGFIGEVTLALCKALRGKARFRRLDLAITIQESGAQALPIVTLISLLVGVILAFIAMTQLRVFGAQIYVADVVGVGMFRVMGAVMTGVIMSGRTGAAFAAQLGTMQVNEEIDALETLGFSPTEFLVLPRMLALMLMMPLLCVYADLMGVLGGMIVGVAVLELGFLEYLNQTLSSLSLTHLLIGLFHSLVFGVIVAVSGCLRGIQCERSASAVGYAATSAVVTAIVWMVVATALITFSCEILGI